MQHALELGVVSRFRTGNCAAGLLELKALVNQERRVAAVIEDQVRSLSVGPVQGLEGAPPVLGKRFALPREHWNARGGIDGPLRTNRDGRGGVILGGEDVATGPANLRTEIHQRLDEDGGLNRHVQGAGDSGALEGRLALMLGAKRHEPGHLVFREFDLLAAVGDGLRGEVCDLVIKPRMEEGEIGVEEG